MSINVKDVRTLFEDKFSDASFGALLVTIDPQKGKVKLYSNLEHRDISRIIDRIKELLKTDYKRTTINVDQKE